MNLEIRWIFVPGGTCAFGDRPRPISIGDLLWTLTPITWAQVQRTAHSSIQNAPLSDITHEQATKLAQELEGRLPTSAEWEWMATGSESRLYPWGNEDWGPLRANLRPSQTGHVVPVGSFPNGATPEGVLDVAGNVWEWTASLTLGNGAVVRGGSYNSPVLYARTKFLNAAPRELSSPGIGLRVVRVP